ncbi:MAG: oligosaccharide flippase family protein [Chloroflexi bacterium]|nr:oligosaccharide flippase family protein [Chloroflexota bacterium]
MSARRLGLNSLWLLLARVLTQGLTLVFIALIARRLGVAAFGQYAAMAALVFLGNAVTTFGTDMLLIRETARAGGLTPLAPVALWLQLALSVLWIGSVMGIGFVFPAVLPAARLPLIVYLLSLFPLAFYTVFSALLRAFERMELFLALNLLTALLQTIGAAVLIRSQDDLLRLCAWLTLTQLVAAGLGGVLCSRLVTFAALWRPVRLAEVWALLRVAWPLAALMALALFSQRLSVLMLLPLAGDAATGWFSAAARLVEGLKIGHYAVLGALLPTLSRRSSPEAGRLFRNSWAALLALSALLALALTLLADPIVMLIYGSRFAPAAHVLRLLAWSLIPYTFSAYLSLDFVTRGLERTVLKVTILGAAVSVGLYTLLIPQLGASGAAWGMLAGEGALATLLWLSKRRIHAA